MMPSNPSTPCALVNRRRSERASRAFWWDEEYLTAITLVQIRFATQNDSIFAPRHFLTSPTPLNHREPVAVELQDRSAGGDELDDRHQEAHTEERPCDPAGPCARSARPDANCDEAQTCEDEPQGSNATGPELRLEFHEASWRIHGWAASLYGRRTAGRCLAGPGRRAPRSVHRWSRRGVLRLGRRGDGAGARRLETGVGLRMLVSLRDRWAFGGDPAVPDPTRRDLRLVRWDRIDVAADD
jgi:hypothetical protein